MKKTFIKALAAMLVALMAFCFSACGDSGKNAVPVEEAQKILEDYLVTKGFDKENDFLSEPMVMEINGVSVYAFSWRIKSGEHADKLFGTYAVSFDGTEFYEYQAGRDDWIKCIKAE
ncbi:MAG: hypothetical protein J6C96_02025 [Oscillospiraceae bacterium]|nr:hypothetical protein [Oscillospiraceae bacterium]